MAEVIDLKLFVEKTLLITGGTGTFGNAVAEMGSKAGFGEIRYPVATSPLLGCGPNGAAGSCKDTVRGGPGLLGASAGVVYMLGDSLGVYASLSGLAGVPDVAFNADFNLGVALVR